MEEYFIIRGGEDGLSIEKSSSGKIKELLQEAVEEPGSIKFLGDFPEDRWSHKRKCINSNNFLDDGEILLLKGKIVVPQKKESVTVYQVE